jgi:phosphosulfolactate phosphohydrolase-like enzyme
MIRIRGAFLPAIGGADIHVFFDIFRASTTLLAILSQHPAEVLATNSEAMARSYQAKGYHLVSEVFAGGFDNSPTKLLKANLQGERIVHKSTNLTPAMFASGFAKRNFIGSFVNMSALARHLDPLASEFIELIPAGHFAKERQAQEDSACAEMLALCVQCLRAGKPFPSSIPRAEEIMTKIEDLRTRKVMPPHYWEDLTFSTRLDVLPILAEVVPIGPDLVTIRTVELNAFGHTDRGDL